MKFRTIFTHVIGSIHIAPCATDLQTPHRGPTQLANDHRPPATSSLAHWLTGHPNGPLTAPSPPTTHHRLTGTRLTGSPTYTALPANRLTGSPTHWLTGSLATTGHLLTCSGSPATCSPAHRPPAHLTGSPATCSPTHRPPAHRPPAHRPPAGHRPAR